MNNLQSNKVIMKTIHLNIFKLNKINKNKMNKNSEHFKKDKDNKTKMLITNKIFVRVILLLGWANKIIYNSMMLSNIKIK